MGRESGGLQKKYHSSYDNKPKLGVSTSSATPNGPPMFEYSEIGWEGPTDELVFFILIGGCQCVADDETLPLIDERVTKIGISFVSHRKYKSILQILYITKDKQQFTQQQQDM